LSAIGIGLAHWKGRWVLPSADEERKPAADTHAEERLNQREGERHRKRGCSGWMEDARPPVDENGSCGEPQGDIRHMQPALGALDTQSNDQETDDETDTPPG
jgi:hypothetical protein